MKKLMAIAALLSMTLSFHVSAMSAAPETGYTETRYPIVLVHGFLGWDTMLGIDYWYQITEALQEGGADVYVVTVPNANTPEVRGEELIPQIEEILALTGAQRVNLIGHSHGGPTTRYVASVRPELVASVTSVSGVNKGTPIADTLIATAEDSAAFDAIFGGIVNLAAEALNLISGADYDDVNAMIAIASMTSERAVVFNQQHPGGIPVDGDA